MSVATDFSDYIIYVDESGDHGLKNIDPDFPMFCLAFCVVKKSNYIEKVVPAIQAFKFKYFGHDAVILHEREIRRTENAFSFLRKDASLRNAFLNDLSEVLERLSFAIIPDITNKNDMQQLDDGFDLYQSGLTVGMSNLRSYLLENNQENCIQHIIFESRGKQEDRALEVYFRRLSDELFKFSDEIKFEAIFAKKSVNSAGLQMADLVARPMALKKLNPEQNNRAFRTIENKLYDLSEYLK